MTALGELAAALIWRYDRARTWLRDHITDRGAAWARQTHQGDD